MCFVCSWDPDACPTNGVRGVKKTSWLAPIFSNNFIYKIDDVFKVLCIFIYLGFTFAHLKKKKLSNKIIKTIMNY